MAISCRLFPPKGRIGVLKLATKRVQRALDRKLVPELLAV